MARAKGKRKKAEEQVVVEDESGPEVGANLRRIRMERGLALEALAQASGVSRAMLSQIELGRSTPTIKLLWKISRALGLPFAALVQGAPSSEETRVMRGDSARRLTSHDGRFSSRALFPVGRARRIELYELKLAARGLERAEPHAPGTVEILLVTSGAVEISIDRTTFELGAGDAIQFRADGPHAYRNVGTSEAVMSLVMSYPDHS
jgi:transcriptional regulator with XRE-family HTH domain